MHTLADCAQAGVIRAQGQAIEQLREEVAEIHSELRSFAMMAPNLDALLGDITHLRHDINDNRKSTESHERVMGSLHNKLTEIEKSAQDLLEWKSDSKVQEIATLRKALSDRVMDDKTLAADRRRGRYQIIAAILAALAALAAGRASSHLAWSGSPVGIVK